jgi:hypothetical protein
LRLISKWCSMKRHLINSYTSQNDYHTVAKPKSGSAILFWLARHRLERIGLIYLTSTYFQVILRFLETSVNRFSTITVSKRWKNQRTVLTVSSGVHFQENEASQRVRFHFERFRFPGHSTEFFHWKTVVKCRSITKSVIQIYFIVHRLFVVRKCVLLTFDRKTWRLWRQLILPAKKQSNSITIDSWKWNSMKQQYAYFRACYVMERVRWQRKQRNSTTGNSELGLWRHKPFSTLAEWKMK